MLQSARNDAARAEVVARHLVHAPSRTVLVVDDEPSIQHLLSRMLRLRDFDPAPALTIAGAVRVAEERPLGAIVLDLVLGEHESGLDFLAWLRAQPQHFATPVLILTGQLRLREDEEAIIRQHRAYVFFKPQSFARLGAYLTRLIDSDAQCA